MADKFDAESFEQSPAVQLIGGLGVGYSGGLGSNVHDQKTKKNGQNTKAVAQRTATGAGKGKGGTVTSTGTGGWSWRAQRDAAENAERDLVTRYAYWSSFDKRRQTQQKKELAERIAKIQAQQKEA